MIDIVASAAGAPLQRDELRIQLAVVEQLDLAGIEQRQAIAVDRGLGPVGQIVRDATLLQPLSSPLAGAVVAGAPGQPPGLEPRTGLRAVGIGRESRSC